MLQFEFRYLTRNKAIDAIKPMVHTVNRKLGQLIISETLTKLYD